MHAPLCLSARAPQCAAVRKNCTVSRIVVQKNALRTQQLSSFRVYSAKDGSGAVDAPAAEDDTATTESSDQAEETSDEEQLSTCQLLANAIKAGEYSEAETLSGTVVTEFTTLASIVEAAQAETKATKATLDNTKDQFRRLQADFDNFRSRSDTEKKQTSANVKMKLVEDLLPVIDGFESASTQVKATTPEEEKINGSYQGLYRQMVESFRAMGLEAVPTEGAAFDPEVHDAIVREENSELEEGTVLQEFRKGFKFAGKLLRPAMVKVAFKPEAADESEEAGEEAEKSEAQ